MDYNKLREIIKEEISKTSLKVPVIKGKLKEEEDTKTKHPLAKSGVTIDEQIINKATSTAKVTSVTKGGLKTEETIPNKATANAKVTPVAKGGLKTEETIPNKATTTAKVIPVAKGGLKTEEKIPNKATSTAKVTPVAKGTLSESQISKMNTLIKEIYSEVAKEQYGRELNEEELEELFGMSNIASKISGLGKGIGKVASNVYDKAGEKINQVSTAIDNKINSIGNSIQGELSSMAKTIGDSITEADVKNIESQLDAIFSKYIKIYNELKMKKAKLGIKSVSATQNALQKIAQARTATV